MKFFELFTPQEAAEYSHRLAVKVYENCDGKVRHDIGLTLGKILHEACEQAAKRAVERQVHAYESIPVPFGEHGLPASAAEAAERESLARHGIGY